MYASDWAKPVVQVAGDAGPLGLGAEAAQAQEPQRVVDGEGQRAGQALEQRDVVGAVTTGHGVLHGHEAHHAASCPQRDVHAAARHRRAAPSVVAREQVGLEDGRAVVEHRAQRLGEQVAAQATGESQAFGELDVPFVARVVANEEGERPELEQRPQPRARRVDHLVQVERSRKGLRDPVQRDEELVRRRQARDLIPGRFLVQAQLVDEAAGERSEHAAEQEQDADLGRGALDLSGRDPARSTTNMISEERAVREAGRALADRGRSRRGRRAPRWRG